MTAVEAQVRRSATLPVARDRVWNELADVARLDRLMPDVESYQEVDHGWRWELEPRRVMGYRIHPRFTVTYDLAPPERLAFEHVSGERGDTADSHGAFTLGDDAGETRVTVELAVRLDVDVPSLLRAAVREILRDELREMADGFLDNLRAAVGS